MDNRKHIVEESIDFWNEVSPQKIPDEPPQDPFYLLHLCSSEEPDQDGEIVVYDSRGERPPLNQQQPINYRQIPTRTNNSDKSVLDAGIQRDHPDLQRYINRQLAYPTGNRKKEAKVSFLQWYQKKGERYWNYQASNFE